LDGREDFRACARNDLRGSNLAANLLLDFVGVEYARRFCGKAHVDGVSSGEAWKTTVHTARDKQ